MNGEEEEQQERKKKERAREETESFTGTSWEHETKREQMASRMSLVWCAIALASAAMAAVANAATTHVVGGDEGWRVPTNETFYDMWAADKTFNVGDKLGKELVSSFLAAAS